VSILYQQFSFVVLTQSVGSQEGL